MRHNARHNGFKPFIGLMVIAATIVLSADHAFALRQLLWYQTNMGDFVVEMYLDTPITNNNYLGYVNSGQQDNLLIHRKATPVTSGLSVIQGGGIGFDPASGFFFAPTNPGIDADVEATHSNVRGTIAMAEGGDLFTSQWFINTTDNTLLDKNPNDPNDPDDSLVFVAFGEVIEGMPVVDNIFAQPIVDVFENSEDALDTMPFEDGRNSPPDLFATADELIEVTTVVAVGDTNFSSTWDAADIDELAANLGSNSTFFDVDRDGGNADQQDFDAIVRDVFETEFGDANLDQRISIADLDALGTNFSQAGGWAQGDFNGDGQVSIVDLDFIGRNFGFDNTTPAAPAVPEPATMSLIGLAGLAILRRRR